MHIVIYKFQVKPNESLAFMDAWEGLTNLIYQFEGSLGSRLHKIDELNYLAYAQWPSKDVFSNAGANLPKSADVFRSKMKDSCDKIETLHEMEVVSDLLKQDVF